MKIFLAAIASLIFLPSTVFSQNIFTSNSDILGLTLSMSTEEAINLLKTNFVVLNFKDLKSQLATNDYTGPEIIISYQLLIISKEEQKMNNAQLEEEMNNAGGSGAMVLRETSSGVMLLRLQ